MANEDYKNGKLVEIVREFNHIKGTTRYEINGITQSIAVPFWREEEGKFKAIPKGSYKFISESGNNYLEITDETILQQAFQFQIVYVYSQISSKYVEDFPELSVLTTKYNELVDDATKLFSYLKSVGMIADTFQMTKVLSPLEPMTTWYMDEQREIKALPISELYGKFEQMIEHLKKILEEYATERGLLSKGIIHQIKQLNHGFIFEPITYDNGTWKKADISTGADGMGVVKDKDNFYFVEAGEIEIPKNAVDKDNNPILEDEYYYLNENGFGLQKEEPVWYYQPVLHTRRVNGKLVADVNVETMENLRSQVVDTDSIHSYGLATLNDIPQTFDTIEKLQKAFWLKEGEVVEVLGYYSAGDGAGHKRIIANEDDGSGVQLSNGLWANIYGNTIYSSHLGLRNGDDCKIKINSAIKRNITNKIVINGKYTVKKLSHGTALENIELINIKSNMVLEFEKNSQIKLITNNEDYYRILNIKNVENVDIINPNIIGDAKEIGISVGEYGHGISVYESSNIRIINSCVDSCFGDGIYIYRCKNVSLLGNHKISNCGRQGISVVGCLDFFADKIYAKNINRTQPAAGIDFEPNLSYLEEERESISGYVNYLYCEDVGRALLVAGKNKKNIIINTIISINSKYQKKESEIEIQGGETDDVNVNIYNIYIEKPKNTPLVLFNYVNNTLNVNIGTITSNEYTREAGQEISKLSTVVFQNLKETSPRININKIFTKKNIFPDNSLYYSLYFNSDTPVLSEKYSDIKIRFRTDNTSENNSYYLIPNSNIVFDRTCKITSENYSKIANFIVDDEVFITDSDFVYFPKVDLINIINPQKNTFTFSKIYYQGYTISNPSDINYSEISEGLIIIGFDGYLYIDNLNKKLKFINRVQNIISSLNTPYMATKMKQEGVYNDYITYMDEKTLYDKQQRKLEQDRQLAYEEALKENPELTYEEFMSVQPMTLNLMEEPQPSENLKQFMDKYL